MSLKVWTLIVLSVICGAYVYGNAPSTGAHFSYALSPSLQWEETDLDTWGDKITNFELIKNRNVVMNFTYFNQDMHSELKTRGMQTVVSDIMRGKNRMFELIGAENVRLISSSVSAKKGYDILELNLEYQTNNKTFLLTEKFHLIPKKVFISSFRYSGAKTAEVEKARADFENVVVTIKE